MGEIAEMMMEDYFDNLDSVAMNCREYTRAYDQEDDPKPFSIWTTAGNTETSIENMKTQHINNCILMIEEGRAIHLNERQEKGWLKAFKKELKSR